MCGVIAVIRPFNQDASDDEQFAYRHALRALWIVEPRGYDSTGIGWINPTNNAFERVRALGDSAALEREVSKLASAPKNARVVIGHTRWATHGGITVPNAHPHVAGSVMLVHNGTITNAEQHRQHLSSAGWTFEGETDSEVAAAVLNNGLRESSGNRAADFVSGLSALEGDYALIVCYADQPDRVYIACKGKDLCIGRSTNGMYVASEPDAIASWCNDVVFMRSGQFAVVTCDGIAATGRTTNAKSAWRPSFVPIEITPSDPRDYEGFAHAMIAEINRSTETVSNLHSHLPTRDTWLRWTDPSDPRHPPTPRRIVLTGCGSSYHAALFAARLLTEAGHRAVAILASELQTTQLEPGDILIALSQSGTTHDVLEALKRAREGDRARLTDVTIIGITSRAQSALTRVADHTVLIGTRPERSVAATESFTAQLVTLAHIVNIVSHGNGYSREELRQIGALIRRVIDTVNEPARIFAHTHLDTDSLIKEQERRVFVLGADLLAPIALEGALKLMETAYLDAYGRASGELKHGTLALLDKWTITIALMPTSSAEQQEGLRITLGEIAGREHGRIVVLGSENDGSTIKCLRDSRDNRGNLLAPIQEREGDPVRNAIAYTVALQVFAYHLAVQRNGNPDRPRNLAKTVTVH